jgi:hypothetical protein
MTASTTPGGNFVKLILCPSQREKKKDVDLYSMIAFAPRDATARPIAVMPI